MSSVELIVYSYWFFMVGPICWVDRISAYVDCTSTVRRGQYLHKFTDVTCVT
nr:MAG TPA: hypothetical protein [Caudoviricetes sp.]